MYVAGVKGGAILLGMQVIFIILFAIFVEYDPSANTKDPSDEPNIDKYYPMFQDVHVMIFVGFGFLMTFLRRYGFSSVGLNLLISAFVIQWHILFSGFLHLHDGKIQISITGLLGADFAVAAVLITFGALLGKTSPLQMIVIAFIEIIVFTVNEHIGIKYIKVEDIGGSMFVHAFGAYFGLAVARVLYRDDVEDSNKEGSVYHSDMFAMIGTLFLWMFWPSFNSALAEGDDRHRAIINTYLALVSCTITAFAVSALISKENKFDMVHVQNATLAGGVAVGTSANMMIGPYGALLIGALAGALSVTGYRYISPWLSSKLRIHDTCGVNNLHGMPGLMAGIAGCVASALATTDDYGYSLYEVFPQRAPRANSTELNELLQHLDVPAAAGRTAGKQAGMQAVALVMTVAVAIVTGLLTGLLLRLPIFDQPKGQNLFEDSQFWETPEDHEERAHPANGAAQGKLLGERDEKV